jgi:hypothetical protein
MASGVRVLGTVPPGRMFFVSVLVTTAVVPISIAIWMAIHGGFIGSIQLLSVRGGQATDIDPKWTYAIIALISLVTYGILASLTYLAVHRASLRTRNLAIVGSVPLYFAAVWLLIWWRK